MNRIRDVIVLETRNVENKQVKFSALNYRTQKFLWRDRMLEEAWWINLTATSGGVVIFTLSQNNLEKKDILVYDLLDCTLIWWKHDFSITSVTDDYIIGVSEKFGMHNVALDLHTGKEVQPLTGGVETHEAIIRPSQYLADHSYFTSVKTFFSQKFNLLPITALEYLEYESMIFISCYLQEDELANYLFILSSDGNLLLKEKLNGHLKGIGLDTFFILSGCVFFVKNKVELVSYKIL